MLAITDKNIEIACNKYGAKAVSDAAYLRMNGNNQSLIKVGIENAKNLAEANQIATIAYALMSPNEKSDNFATAVIDTAKLKE